VKNIIAIRGATTCQQNTREHILEATQELLHGIIRENNVHEAEIVNIMFTATPDIDAAFPAEAARALGLTTVPLLGAQELAVAGAPLLCIRVMFLLEKELPRAMVKHIYLRGAVGLRPDLVGVSVFWNINIAIDGPAGAGKSTVAKTVAKTMGLRYLDTGAMYRTLTWLALEKGLDLGDAKSLNALALSLDFNLNANSELTLASQVLGDEIRTPQVNAAVSMVSSHAAVRDVIVRQQQHLAASGGIVMDGRDIGTTVLVQAQVKIFLVADPRERARRRLRELEALGHTVDLAQVVEQIEQRDHFDSHRAVSPLKPAADAIIVDTTDLPIDQVIQQILDIVARKQYGL